MCLSLGLSEWRTYACTVPTRVTHIRSSCSLETDGAGPGHGQKVCLPGDLSCLSAPPQHVGLACSRGANLCDRRGALVRSLIFTQRRRLSLPTTARSTATDTTSGNNIRMRPLRHSQAFPLVYLGTTTGVSVTRASGPMQDPL